MTASKIFFYLESLGCAKNQVDSEHVIGFLENRGFSHTENPSGASFIVVNTCGFIHDAKIESIETTLELKNRYPEKKVIMIGCLATRYADQLKTEMPDIEIIALPVQKKAFSRLLEEKLVIGIKPKSVQRQNRRHLLSLPGSVYVKIADGCANNCSYCAIPLIKGPLESRSRSEISRETAAFLKQGIREINLIAQDTASYGRDRGKGELAALLSDLDRLPGDFWIRLLYIHPDHVDHEIVETVAASKKILPYFDIPFQHASPRILAAMNRKGDGGSYRETVQFIRKLLPAAVIRTTFLVGFPGETEEDFAVLVAFLQAIKPQWSGVFSYSREEGTPAYSLKNAVPKKTAEKRKKLLEETQTRITQTWLDSLLTKETDVLIEETVTGENLSLGRAFFQAPEVDGLVVVEGEKDAPAPGTFVRVRLEKRSGIDLKACRIDG